MNIRKTTTHTYIGCIAAYIIVLFRHGYVFGSGDHSESFPYAKYLNDSSLYEKDFYIQNISQHIPNERYFFSWLMAFFDRYMEHMAFFLHALASFFLIYGLYRLAQKWLSTEGGYWIATIAPILFLYNINLGGNEIYYNLLVPSYLAQVLGIWVFVFIVEAKIWHSYPLLVFITYLHPLIGLQLWILISIVLLRSVVEERKTGGVMLFMLMSCLYLALVGKYLYDIRYGYDSETVSNSIFFNIMEFRAAHHYFPQYFPLKSWIIILPLVVQLFFQARTFLRTITLAVTCGLIIYSIGVLYLKNTAILSAQWFSTTIWLKTFAIMFLISLVEDLILNKKYWQVINDKRLIFNILCILSIPCFLMMTPQLRLFKDKPYDFFFFKNSSPEKNISLQAQAVTSHNALFLIPADLSEFRYWSERSSYIDYKATNHRKAAFAEWYDRIQTVYKISYQNRLNGDNLMTLANQNYKALRETDILQLAEKQGITHMITFKTHQLSFEKLCENEKYVLLRVKE